MYVQCICDYYCHYKYNCIDMLQYSRDYAIVFGIGHRPLASDKIFRRAASEAICRRDITQKEIQDYI